VLATDGRLAVILEPDRKTVRVIDAVIPQGRNLWSGELGLDPEAAITATMVILRDSDRGRLFVLRVGFPMSVVLELKSRAEIAGFGANAIVITSGRSIGYHHVTIS
jgi:hypothetical protein